MEGKKKSNKQKNKRALLLSRSQNFSPAVPHPAPDKRTAPATAVSLPMLLCISLLLPVSCFLDSCMPWEYEGLVLKVSLRREKMICRWRVFFTGVEYFTPHCFCIWKNKLLSILLKLKSKDYIVHLTSVIFLKILWHLLNPFLAVFFSQSCCAM